MRVHRLELRAFGPFAGTEAVDFDSLNDTGIFLLTGPTGAGKTSILDAICFALYGAVPGARNRAKSFKSQHAAEEEVPRVELEATIRGRRFRIARSPAWRRPSRRAKGGFVDEHAKVLVEEHVGDDWIARATRLDEAGLLIGRVLGMTQEQFCQVVMLPQGQFETFLRSDAKERHDLLETLFETSRFRRVEQWLAEARRTRETAWERAQARIDQVLARAVEVAGRTPVARELGPEQVAASGQDETSPAVPVRDGGDSSVLPAERVLEQLRLWEAEIVELAASAEVRSAAQLVAAKAARHGFDEATRLAERQERHREARRRLVALRTAQSTADERAHRVRSAQAAATLAPLVAQMDEAEQSLAAARAVCDEARLALRAHDDLALGLGDEPGAELAGTREHRGRVAGLTTVEADVRRLTAELTGRRSELADCEAALETLEERATAIPATLAEARALVDAASAAAADVDAATDLLARSVERLDAARAVEQLSVEVASMAAEHLALREERVTASERMQELRERRLSGVAAELALGLEPGCPCPVCGSAAHPRPAEPFGDRVTEIDETQAAAVLRRAEADLETCTERLATLRADLVGAERGAAQIGVAAAQEAVVTAQARLDGAVHGSAALAAHQADVAALSTERGRVETKIAELRTTIIALRTASGDTAAALARHREVLGAVLGQHGSVDARLAAIDRRVAMLERLVTAEHDQQEVVARRDRHRLQLEDALADSEFTAVSEVRRALLSKAEVANLEALNRAHDEEVAAVTRVITDPGLVEAAEQEAPDLVALSLAAEAADQQRAEAHAEARALTQRRDRLDGLLADLDQLLDQAAPLRTAVDVAARVASMVAGTSRDNEHKTKLSHYVVAARLEQVVSAANVRLRDIGGGRYQLEHSLSRGAGSSRGGLSLVVLDAYTGLGRDPVTLSGGETFYVSLALALGLADLVRAEAGAADLSTLFVDEGFGGLDAETLDEVMDTIDELRAGGRCVGLVSHLSELRTRIPTQVQVVRSRSGSRIEALS